MKNLRFLTAEVTATQRSALVWNCIAQVDFDRAYWLIKYRVWKSSLKIDPLLQFFSDFTQKRWDQKQLIVMTSIIETTKKLISRKLSRRPPSLLRKSQPKQIVRYIFWH